MRKDTIFPFACYIYSLLLFMIIFLSIVVLSIYNDTPLSMILSLMGMLLSFLYFFFIKSTRIFSVNRSIIYILSILNGIHSFNIFVHFRQIVAEDSISQALHPAYSLTSYIYLALICSFILLTIYLIYSDQKIRFNKHIKPSKGLLPLLLFDFLMIGIVFFFKDILINYLQVINWLIILLVICILYYVYTILTTGIMKRKRSKT